MDLVKLNSIIVAAKRATYIGNGDKEVSSRLESHDLSWRDGDWRYCDSYFGGTDFLGQEVVWLKDQPVWAMNYYGYVVRDDLIDAQGAAETIKPALSALYDTGRFLGGWQWTGPSGVYEDISRGDVGHFSGRETISCAGIEAYALDYGGGLIRD